MSANKMPNQLSANSKKLNNFHASQNFNLFIFMVAIIAVLASLPLGYKYYQEKINPDTAFETSFSSSGEPTEDGIDPAYINKSSDIGQQPSSAGQQQPSNQAPIATTPSAPPPASTGTVAAIPAGVDVALKSIEQSGIKNNPYIAIDTSSIPPDTIFTPMRNSWSQTGSDSGSLGGSLNMYGQNITGTLTFQYSNSTWKVVGYSMAN